MRGILNSILSFTGSRYPCCSILDQLKDLLGIIRTLRLHGIAVVQPVCDKCMDQFLRVVLGHVSMDFNDVMHTKEAGFRGL